MERVCLVMASQTWIEGVVPIWLVATTFLYLGCWFTVRQRMSSVCSR